MGKSIIKMRPAVDLVLGKEALADFRWTPAYFYFKLISKHSSSSILPQIKLLVRGKGQYNLHYKVLKHLRDTASPKLPS